MLPDAFRPCTASQEFPLSDRSSPGNCPPPAGLGAISAWKGVSQFCRAGPLAFSPGRLRPGSGEDEARERPSPPWQPGFPKGYRRERALPAPWATSARPFTA